MSSINKVLLKLSSAALELRNGADMIEANIAQLSRQEAGDLSIIIECQKDVSQASNSAMAITREAIRIYQKGSKMTTVQFRKFTSTCYPSDGVCDE